MDERSVLYGQGFVMWPSYVMKAAVGLRGWLLTGDVPSAAMYALASMLQQC
jgi:hypothetical protein